MLCDSKLQVYLSIIYSIPKIDWGKVYIPEGRSLKAVKCMLDGSRKIVKNLPGGEGTAKNKAGKKRKRGEDAGEEDDDGELLEQVKKDKKYAGNKVRKDKSKGEGKSEGGADDRNDQGAEEMVKVEVETD